MKIQKISLKDENIKKPLYSYPEGVNPGAEHFKLAISIDAFSEAKALKFGSSTVSSMHVLVEGEGRCQYEEGRTRDLLPGGVCSCEEGETIGVEGRGRLFNLLMDGGVRGFIRQMPLDKRETLKVGEGVGESVITYLGIDGGFTLETGDDRWECSADEGIVLQLEQKEFHTIGLTPEKEGQTLISASGVCLSPADFGKYIGVQFLERGAHTCKTRLDIRPEHMNPIRTVHGGCLFTLADATCGVAASSTGGICTTVNSTIQFLNGAFDPKYLIAEAKPKKIGRKIRSYIVDIWDDKGVLICTVDFVFYSLQK